MKILFCGYRSWALDVFEKLKNNGSDITLADCPSAVMEAFEHTKYDLVLVVGWSWLIPNVILDSSYVAGMHPSDLPDYAGGSPIQNQILDGVEATNATLFRLTSTFDAGPILGKTKINLQGHMSDIFAELTRVTVILLNDLIKSYPNIVEIPQAGPGKHVRRLKANNSQLPNIVHEKKVMTCKEMWNFIRCREDPYPNVFFEDDTGKLIIKRVEFEPK